MKSIRNMLVVFVMLFIAVSQVSADTVRLYAMQNAEFASDPTLANNTFLDGGILTVHSYTYLIRSILKFDLSSIPNGAQITGANVSLFSRTWWSGVFGYDIDVSGLSNDAWAENTVTWNNYMVNNYGTSTALGSLSNNIGDAYNSWQLDMNAWNYAGDLTDNYLTLLFKIGNQWEGDWIYRDMQYFSRVVPNPNALVPGEIRPYLELTYTPVPLPSSLLLLGPGLAGLALLRRRLKK